MTLLSLADPIQFLGICVNITNPAVANGPRETAAGHYHRPLFSAP